MKKHYLRLLALSAVFGLLPMLAQSQQVDMDAMRKWGAADLVRYHIVGVYKAQTFIASDGSGLADVTDRIVIDLSWKLSEAKLVGQPTFQNAKSATTNLRDREPSCLPPVLKGEYEHAELLAIKEGMGGALELQMRTSYPIVEVAQFCTDSRRSVPAKVVTEPEELGVPSPVLFAMPIPASDELTVSADKKSIIFKKAGWTWTFTPSVAGK